jgi:hypothetical protein
LEFMLTTSTHNIDATADQSVFTDLAHTDIALGAYVYATTNAGVSMGQNCEETYRDFVGRARAGQAIERNP